MRPFIEIMKRDLRLSLRQGGSAALAIAFFFITVTFFPLGIGPESAILSRISVGVIWVSALLSTMLSLDRLFQADFEDGSLDLLALASLPLELTVISKCLAHWLTTGLPLMIIAPVLALLLNINTDGLYILIITMLLGTPSLSLIGAIGAALTVGVRRGGIILSLLVLPLYIPVLIFGTTAVEAEISGLSPSSHLLVLGAIFMVSLALSPWVSAAALRLNLE